MSEARRRELLDLSSTYGVPVFEDECYADLTWEGKRPPALRAMAGGDRVVHIGSFSKTIAPALRMGYLVAGWSVMSRILSIKTDGGSGALEQMIVAEYCRDHFDTHVRALRQTVRKKLDALVDALQLHFGGAAEIEYPAGGIFLWVKLPDVVDTMRLCQVAQGAGVAFNHGAEWTTAPAIGKSRLRLCFAHPSEQTIREGVRVLADVCRREFGVPSQPAGVHR